MRSILRYALIGSWLSSGIQAPGQKATGSVQLIEREFGTKLLGNVEIKGREYRFVDRIHETYFDTTSNKVTVQLRPVSKNGKWLRNAGEVVVYDLAAKKLKWRKSINYGVSFIEQLNSLIIETGGGKSHSLNIETGNPQWEIKNAIYYMDPVTKTGLGYSSKQTKEASNKLVGINLWNGSEIWSREVPRDYGWNAIRRLNDSVLAVIASGIHTIHLKTGSGWAYDALTGQKDYTSTIAANAAGVALGVLTGSYFVASGHNTIRSVVSNSVVDSTSIYLATREKLTCLDLTTGSVRWSFPLEKGLMSSASLFIRKGVLYLIGEGYAFMGERQLDYGKPFISAFDPAKGKLIYLIQIPGRGAVCSLVEDKQICTLLFKNSAVQYDLRDGKMLATQNFLATELGDMRYFIGDNVCLKQDSVYKSLAQSDTTKMFAYTTKDKILIIDKGLKVNGQINREDIFIYQYKYLDYHFLLVNGKTLLLDPEMRTVAEFDFSGSFTIIGKTLFKMDNQSIFEIDLSEIIPDKEPSKTIVKQE